MSMTTNAAAGAIEATSDVPGHVALTEAVRLCGGQSALASAIGANQGFVSQWVSCVRPVPAEHCPAIERATEEKVRCEDLRPDLHWVRGDSREILGYLTPVDNATPEYVRASLRARAAEEADAVMDAWLPEGFLSAGKLDLEQGTGPFRGLNSKYIPCTIAGEIELDGLHYDAVQLIRAARSIWSTAADQADETLWGAMHLFELAGEAIELYHKEAGGKDASALHHEASKAFRLLNVFHRRFQNGELGVLDPDRPNFFSTGSCQDLSAIVISLDQALGDYRTNVKSKLTDAEHDAIFREGYIDGIMHGVPDDVLKNSSTLEGPGFDTAINGTQQEFNEFCDRYAAERDAKESDRGVEDTIDSNEFCEAVGVTLLLDENDDSDDLREALLIKHGFHTGEDNGQSHSVRIKALIAEVRAMLQARFTANCPTDSDVDSTWRLGYLRGLLHRLPEAERSRAQDLFKFEELEGTDSMTNNKYYKDLVEEIADWAEGSDPWVYYSNAFGIVHGITDDKLRDQLLEKHNFYGKGDNLFTGRNAELDALYADVQGIQNAQSAAQEPTDEDLELAAACGAILVLGEQSATDDAIRAGLLRQHGFHDDRGFEDDRRGALSRTQRMKALAFEIRRRIALTALKVKEETDNADDPAAASKTATMDATQFCTLSPKTHLFSTVSGIPVSEAMDECSTILFCVVAQLRALAEGEDSKTHPHLIGQLGITQMAVEQAKALVDSSLDATFDAERHA